MAPLYVSMEEYTAPKHSRDTLSFDEYAANFEENDVPRWQARRVAIAMSHSENIETKIILG